MNSTYQYPRLNLMKFIGAFLVIAIHTHPFFNLSWGLDFFVVNIVGRVAVPFYLITSGFFFYPKVANGMNKTKIRDYVLKLIQLYVVWSLIYLMINFSTYFVGKSPVIALVHVVRNFLFTAIDVHLWYLSAVAFGIIVIVVILRMFDWRVLIGVNVGCILLLLLTQTYAGLIQGTVIASVLALYERLFGGLANSFIMAIPFLTIGMLIRKYELLKKDTPVGGWCLVAFILLVIEQLGVRVLGLATDYTVSLSLLLFSTLFFIEVGRWDKRKPSPLLMKYDAIFRESSLWIYLIHVAFLRLLLVIYQQLGIENPRLITFLLISVASVLSYFFVRRFRGIYQWVMMPTFFQKGQRSR